MTSPKCPVLPDSVSVTFICRLAISSGSDNPRTKGVGEVVVVAAVDVVAVAAVDVVAAAVDVVAAVAATPVVVVVVAAFSQF